VGLEGGEPRDHLPLPTVCGHAVGDALLGIRDDAEDGLPQLLQRLPLRLVQPGQVFIDPAVWHPIILVVVRYFRYLFWILPASFLVPLAVFANDIVKSNFGRDGGLEQLGVIFSALVVTAELLLLGIAIAGARLALRGRIWLAGLTFGGISVLQLSSFVWLGPYNRSSELALAVPAIVAVILIVFWLPAIGSRSGGSS